MPDRIAPGEARTVEVLVASTRKTSFVEVDDARGRVSGALMELRDDPSGVRRGSFALPKLRDGLYWLVTASERRGPELMESATMARPFVVAPTPEEGLAFVNTPPCKPPPDPKGDVKTWLGACLALVRPPSLPRWLALDGFPALRESHAVKQGRAERVAFGALGVGAVIETILLVGTALEARRRLRRAREENPELGDVRKRFDALTVIAAVLLGLLGFVFVAALLMHAI
jgi:hypothetical protein